jgi:hypothetical protein
METCLCHFGWGKKEDDSKLVKLAENPPKQASTSILMTINLVVVPFPLHIDPALHEEQCRSTIMISNPGADLNLLICWVDLVMACFGLRLCLLVGGARLGLRSRL